MGIGIKSDLVREIRDLKGALKDKETKIARLGQTLLV